MCPGLSLHGTELLCHSQQDRVSNFFAEGESDCTKEMGAGQFSIFGAHEENGTAMVTRDPEINRQLKGTSFLLMIAVVFAKELAGDENLASGTSEYPQTPHRKCRRRSAAAGSAKHWHNDRVKTNKNNIARMMYRNYLSENPAAQNENK